MLNIVNEANFPDTEWIAPIAIGHIEGAEAFLLAEDTGEGPIVGVREIEDSNDVLAAPLYELVSRAQGPVDIKLPN